MNAGEREQEEDVVEETQMATVYFGISKAQS